MDQITDAKAEGEADDAVRVCAGCGQPIGAHEARIRLTRAVSIGTCTTCGKSEQELDVQNGHAARSEWVTVHLALDAHPPFTHERLVNFCSPACILPWAKQQLPDD